MLVTLDTSQLERSLLNDLARMNIKVMSVTLDTSHFDMPQLNEFALANTPLMSVTLDTSHATIGPCGPLEQSPLGDNSMHVSTAGLRCALDRGESAAEQRSMGHF